MLTVLCSVIYSGFTTAFMIYKYKAKLFCILSFVLSLCLALYSESLCKFRTPGFGNARHWSLLTVDSCRTVCLCAVSDEWAGLQRETLHSSPTLTSLPVSTEENSRRTTQDTHQDKRLTLGREKLRSRSDCRNLAGTTLPHFLPKNSLCFHLTQVCAAGRHQKQACYQDTWYALEWFYPKEQGKELHIQLRCFLDCLGFSFSCIARRRCV